MHACIRTRIRSARCYGPEPSWPALRPGGSRHPRVATRQIIASSSSPRGALPAAGTRRARLLEEALLLGQHAVQVIETVKNPQGLDPSADLNHGRAMLHRPERSCTDSKALREDGHGVVTREAQRLQADPELR